MRSEGKTRVLVVDDSALVRKAISEALSRDPDIEVVGTAVDPYDARDKILKLSPDVLTLDIEMPRMDGLTFLQLLQQHRPMPVIVISSTTRSASQAALRALELGAVDVLCEPSSSYSIGELRFQLAARIKVAAKARMGLPPPPAGRGSGSRSPDSDIGFGGGLPWSPGGGGHSNGHGIRRGAGDEEASRPGRDDDRPERGDEPRLRDAEGGGGTRRSRPGPSARIDFECRVRGGSGVVGMAGEDIDSVLYLHLGEEFAIRATGAMLGMSPEERAGEAEVNDVVGEITNMVAGGLKSHLNDMGAGCAMSTPGIIPASSYMVEKVPDVVREILGFDCEGARILVELHIHSKGKLS